MLSEFTGRDAADFLRRDAWMFLFLSFVWMFFGGSGLQCLYALRAARAG